MSKPCRLTFAAYKFNELHLHEWYSVDDLINGIDYCRNLLTLGYSHEPLDGFPLRGFISWANKQIAS